MIFVEVSVLGGSFIIFVKVSIQIFHQDFLLILRRPFMIFVEVSILGRPFMIFVEVSILGRPFMIFVEVSILRRPFMIFVKVSIQIFHQDFLLTNKVLRTQLSKARLLKTYSTQLHLKKLFSIHFAKTHAFLLFQQYDSSKFISLYFFR